MVAYNSNSLPMVRPLEHVVMELVKGLPEGANSVAVCVVIENLAAVVAAKVLDYPLYFVKPTEDREAGTVFLIYGVGNLEVAILPPNEGN